MKVGMEALINKTRPTGQQASHQLVSQKCLASYDIFIAKLSSVKFSASQVELKLALLSLNSHPPTPPGQVYLSFF